MPTVPTGSLVTPDGVTLHHRLDGDRGPVLLLVQGGVSDGDATAALAARLVDGYRVLGYDRAGLGRSGERPTPAADPLAAHAADALALLDGVVPGAEVAVFGVSIGAVIALHLAAVAPPRVTTVVAHEPPLPGVLRDPDRERAMDEVERLAAESGPGAAIERMAALTAGGDGREPDAPTPVPAGDPLADVARFLRTEFCAVRAGTLTAADLVGVAPRVVLTGGADSRGRWEYRCAQVLAERLGVAFHEIPGGHGAPVSHPRGVAAAVRSLLAAPGR